MVCIFEETIWHSMMTQPRKLPLNWWVYSFMMSWFWIRPFRFQCKVQLSTSLVPKCRLQTFLTYFHVADKDCDDSYISILALPWWNILISIDYCYPKCVNLRCISRYLYSIKLYLYKQIKPIIISGGILQFNFNLTYQFLPNLFQGDLSP